VEISGNFFEAPSLLQRRAHAPLYKPQYVCHPERSEAGRRQGPLIAVIAVIARSSSAAFSSLFFPLPEPRTQ
jgi:hypothetical protein